MTTKYFNVKQGLTTGNITLDATTGNISGVSNATLGNLVTANYFSGAGNLLSNIQGANVTGAVSSATTAGTVTTAAQPNITSVGTLVSLTSSGNITAANANLGNLVIANYHQGVLTTGAQPNITSVGTLSTLVVGNSTANVTLTDGSGNGFVTATGNVTAKYFIGNVIGSISGTLVVPGNNTDVIFNDSGSAGASDGFTFNKTSNAVSINGNVTSVNASLGNLVTSNYYAGVLTTGAQPNITSVGTLTSANITNDLVVGGNLTVGGSTTYVNSTNTYLEDALITLGGGANNAALTSNDTHDRGLLLDYYTTTPVQAFIGWKTGSSEFEIASNVSVATGVITVNQYANVHAGYFIGNGSALTNITGANVTGTVSAATTAGTVTTAAQPNITSTGTLASLTVSGTTNLGAIGNVTITGGTSGYLLQTNGSGGLSWVSPPSTSTIANGTSNVAIPTSGGNVNTSVGGTANVLVVTSTGANVSGTLNASGNVIAQSKLFVGVSSSTLTNPVAVFSGAGVSYDQVAVINSTGTGSADVAVYGNNGDDTQSWTDIGFTGNAFSDANYTVTAPGDGYLFVQGNTSFGGNLVVATGNKGTTGDIIFSTGGFLTGNIKARLYNANGAFSVTGNILAGNASLGNLVTANYFSGSGNLLSNIQGANVSGAVPSATTAGTVTTAAQPNITSTGTLVSVTVTGNVVAGNVRINGGLSSNRSNVSIPGTSTDTIIDQFPTSSFRSAKYYITGKGTNGYQSAEILLVQDGTNSYITIYGSVCSNSTADLLNFSSNIDGTSGNVRVYANSASASTTVNLIPIYLND